MNILGIAKAITTFMIIGKILEKKNVDFLLMRYTAKLKFIFTKGGPFGQSFRMFRNLMAHFPYYRKKKVPNVWFEIDPINLDIL